MNIKFFLFLIFAGYGPRCIAAEAEPIYPYGPSNGLSFIPQVWPTDPKPSPVMIRVKRGDDPVALLIGSNHFVPLINLDMTFLFDIIRLHKTKGIKFFSEVSHLQETREVPLMNLRDHLNKIRAIVDQDGHECSYDIVDRLHALKTVKFDDCDVPASVPASVMHKWAGVPKEVWDVLKEYSPKVLECFAGMSVFGGHTTFSECIGLDQSVINSLTFFGVPVFGLETMETRNESGIFTELPLIKYGTEEFFYATYTLQSSISWRAFRKYDETYKILSKLSESPSDESRNKEMAQVFLRALENHLGGHGPMPVAKVGCAHFVGSAALLPSLVRWVDEKNPALTIEIKEAYGDWMPAPRDTFADPKKGISVEEYDAWKATQTFDDEDAPKKVLFERLVELPLSYTSRTLKTFSLGNVTFAFTKGGLDELPHDEAKMLQSYDIVYMRNFNYLSDLRMMLKPHLEIKKNTFNPSWGNFVAYEPYIGLLATKYSRDYFKEIGEKHPLWSYFFLDIEDPVLDVVTHDSELVFRLAFDGTEQEIRPFI